MFPGLSRPYKRQLWANGTDRIIRAPPAAGDEVLCRDASAPHKPSPEPIPSPRTASSLHSFPKFSAQ